MSRKLPLHTEHLKVLRKVSLDILFKTLSQNKRINEGARSDKKITNNRGSLWQLCLHHVPLLSLHWVTDIWQGVDMSQAELIFFILFFSFWKFKSRIQKLQVSI